MTQATTGTVELNGQSIFYEVAGQGNPLVFVHTGFTDRRMWDEQWQKFSRRYTVIRFDLLGLGRSDRLEAPVSTRQQLYRVLEAAGVERAALVGCSLGGETVLDAALERPDLASALVVVSAVPSGFEMQGEPPQDLMEMFAAVGQGDLERANELQMRLWIDGPYRQPDQVDPGVRRRAAEMSRDALAKGTWGLILAPPPNPLEPPAVQRLGAVRAPTLIVAGALDNTELVRAAGVMTAEIPDAQQVILEGCAHLPNMEKPVEFNQALEVFLGGG